MLQTQPMKIHEVVNYNNPIKRVMTLNFLSYVIGSPSFWTLLKMEDPMVPDPAIIIFIMKKTKW